MTYAARTLPAIAVARDARFVVALALGPVIWLAALALTGQGRPAAAMDPMRYASLVLAWPLLEEWLFRGTLQPALARTVWGAAAACGITAANVATSALFAAAHLLSHAPTWAIATFAPSLVFGYFRDRHGNMLPSAVLHVFYNAGWFLLVSA